jgi:hypothetical protein
MRPEPDKSQFKAWTPTQSLKFSSLAQGDQWQKHANALGRRSGTPHGTVLRKGKVGSATGEHG